MKTNLLKRIYLNSFTRKLALALIILLCVQNLLVYHEYKIAEAYLEKNDPLKLQNRSETMFYFAPINLQRGTLITLDEIIQHLKDISYAEINENDAEKLPSTYSIKGSAITIYSRFPKLFPNAVLKFEKNHLALILADNQPVERIQIEPLPMENTVVLVNDSKLDKGLRTRRIVLSPSGIPALVVDAVTRTEDKHFFEHRGVNWLSVVLRPIISRGGSGGSSITQQLIKNNIVFGAKDEFWQTGDTFIDTQFKTLERKLLAELPMAMAIEEKLSKEEIIAAYLSMNYMGNIGSVQLQGFEAASREFFDTNLFEISDENDPADLSKAAILAGMIQSPISYLTYVRNGEKCAENEKKCRNLLKRRNGVLDLMHADLPEKYPSNLIEKAKEQPLSFTFASKKTHERPIEFESRVFIKYAMESDNLPPELQKLRGEEGEAQIFTSLDARLQRAAVDTVNEYMEKLQPSVDAQTQKQKNQNPKVFDEIVNNCYQKNTKDLQACENMFRLKATLIAMDAQSGEILAMTSGIDADSKRSPGSLVKPFFYLKANEIGMLNGMPFTPATFIDKERDKSFLSQYCAEDENLGESGTALDQFINSKNLGACFAAQSADIPTDFVGLLTNSKPERKLIAALGGSKGSETTLLDLIRSYSIFANNGRLVNPTSYKSAFQADKSVFFSKPQTANAANAEATFITNEMMKSVLENGTASNFRQLAGLKKNVQVSGKTGSGMIADLWFIGLTPRIIVGVWVGMPENFPQLKMKDGFTGGKISAPIVAKFMKSISKYRPDLLQGEFYQPEGIIKKHIDQKRGCIVANGGTEMFFILGREPISCS